jgi:hypothetical protein
MTPTAAGQSLAAARSSRTTVTLQTGSFNETLDSYGVTYTLGNTGALITLMAENTGGFTYFWEVDERK